MGRGLRRGGASSRNVFEVKGQKIIIRSMIQWRKYYIPGVGTCKSLAEVAKWLNADVTVWMLDKSDGVVYKFDFDRMAFVEATT